MDYSTYKDFEQCLAEAIDWSEEVAFSADRNGTDTFLVVEFVEEDEGGNNVVLNTERYKLVKAED